MRFLNCGKQQPKYLRLCVLETKQGLSQEKLAELSGCHPTYIGQIERGEKNATIESIEKEQQVDMPEPKVFDNKNFYIYGGIAAAVVLILVIIFA